MKEVFTGWSGSSSGGAGLEGLHIATVSGSGLQPLRYLSS